MAISGNQWQSVAISGDGLTGGHRPEAQLVPQIVRAQHLPYRERTQGSSVAIKRHPGAIKISRSELIRHQSQSRGHPVAIKISRSELIRHRRTSDEALQSR